MAFKVLPRIVSRTKKHQGAPWNSVVLAFAFLLLSLPGCATRNFAPGSHVAASFLEREIIQTQGQVRVAAAVPGEQETEELFGLSLYEKGVQPVWLSVSNDTDKQLRLSIWSVDPDYFSPLEVAWLHRSGFHKTAKREMEQWFFENAIPRRIPPGQTRSGFVFTNLSPGTKGFNLDLFAPDLQSYSFTFFVPIPGFTADYMEVDFASLYSAEVMTEVSENELRQTFGAFPCCSVDESGLTQGEPINVIIVGTGTALRRAFLRTNWRETSTDSPEFALARRHHYRGRRPDGTFSQARPDSRERKELRLWLTPVVAEGLPVWLGQVVYDLSPGNAQDVEIIDPDVDLARLFLLQDLWYSQSLSRFAYVTGGPAASSKQSLRTLGGGTFFSDGLRTILWLSEKPVGLDEVESLSWEQPPPRRRKLSQAR